MITGCLLPLSRGLLQKAMSRAIPHTLKSPSSPSLMTLKILLTLSEAELTMTVLLVIPSGVAPCASLTPL